MEGQERVCNVVRRGEWSVMLRDAGLLFLAVFSVYFRFVIFLLLFLFFPYLFPYSDPFPIYRFSLSFYIFFLPVHSPQNDSDAIGK